MSLDRLIMRIVQKQNPTVLGLDPKFDLIPEPIRKKALDTYGETMEAAAAAILEFNKRLIDALCDIVPAVKPQCAYYEMYGWQGVKALHETILYAKKKGMYVIVDGKRNDIGTTMAAYANAYLGTTALGSESLRAFSGDALTVNGYLGSDGIDPLLEVCAKEDKGIFVLVKTSNPSSGELQDRAIGQSSVMREMGALCESWGQKLPGKHGYSGVGAVVGATYPEQLTELRKELPHTFFLVPGYGAQGGGAKDVAGGFDQNGVGAVVNSSRAILYAYKKEEGCNPKDFAAAARREAVRMRDAIIGEIGAILLPL